MRHGHDTRPGHLVGQPGHPVNFNHENLAQAGATAREALVAMAATRLGASGRSTHRGRRRDQRTSRIRARKSATGELIGGKRFEMTIQKNAKRKPPQQWTMLGRRCRASTCRRSRPRASTPCTTCACRACCTGAWCGRRQSARRSPTLTRAPLPVCRAT